MFYKNAIAGIGLKESDWDSFNTSYIPFNQPKRKPYKLTEDGRYGNLTIDLNKLYGFNRLIVRKDSEILLINMFMVTL